MQQQDILPQKASSTDIEDVFVYSEFINTVKLIHGQQDYKTVKPLSDLDRQSQAWKDISTFHFRQLSVQFFYLVYSCSHKRIVPVPEDNDKCLAYSFDSNNVILLLTEFLTFQTSSIRFYQTTIPYFIYYTNFIKAIHPYWKQVQAKSPPSKRQTMTCDYLLKQLALGAECTNQKDAFNFMQKGDMFIETSILLRIRNCSLICVMKMDQQLRELYRKHRNRQNQLAEEYNDRRKRKNNIQKILQTQKNIEKNIQEFFISLKTNPLYFKVEQKKRKQGGNGIIAAGNKILVGLKVFQLFDMRLPPQQSSSMQVESSKSPIVDEDYYNLYEIEYCSTKNVIIVRLITDLVLDWATSDSILFKWNTLTFETSNVGLQTVEKVDENKKPKKYVVIRGTSYFNKKQPALQKILTLVDITMSTYKSIELQMKSQTFFAKNLAKIDQAYKKINHYLRAIHKCCNKSFASIMAEEDQRR